MDNSVYRPPEANLILESAAETDENMFYVVSPKKFLLLFIGTLGMYQLYWFYENWRKYKYENNLSLWPVPRAIFSIFFTHSLFRKINEELGFKEGKEKWDYATAATLFVLFTLISNADSLFDRVFGELISIFIVLVMVPLTAWVLYGAQLKINLACGSVDGEENSKITGVNIIWLVVGGLLWLMFIFFIVLAINPELYLLLGV